MAFSPAARPQHHPPIRRALLGAVLLGAVLVAAGPLLVAAGPVRADNLAQARARMAKLRGETQVLTARLDAANAALEDLDVRSRAHARQLAAAQARLTGAQRALAAQATSAYRNGGGALLNSILSAHPEVMPERMETLTVLLREQTDAVDEAKAAGAAYDAALREVAADRTAAAAAQRKAKASLDALNARFKQAKALVDRLAGFPGGQGSYQSGPVTVGGAVIACPVEPPYSFTDTYGAPRGGGRSHHGVDIMAPYGAREFAYTSGVISREHSNTLGGITLYLTGDDGNEYYYAHLSRYAVGQGTRVRAGQLVAYVGNSGDARYTAPHLHFEVHVGAGRTVVNPYPYAKRACG